MSLLGKRKAPDSPPSKRQKTDQKPCVDHILFAQNFDQAFTSNQQFGRDVSKFWNPETEESEMLVEFHSSSQLPQFQRQTAEWLITVSQRPFAKKAAVFSEMVIFAVWHEKKRIYIPCYYVLLKHQKRSLFAY
jgi:hypothetical protein